MIRNEKTSIVVLAQRDSQLEHMMKMLQTTSEAELGKNIIIENDPGAVYDHLLCTTTVQMLFFETKGVEFPTGPRKFDRKHALFAVARDARIPIVALAEQWQTKPLDTTMRDLPDPHALVQKNTIDALLEYGTDEQSVQTLQHNMLTLITARAALQAPSPRHAFTAPVIDIISGGPFAGKTVNDNILFDNYTIDRYNILPIMRIKTTSRETVKESPRTHRIDAKTYATWLEKGEIICPYDISERRYG